MPKLEPVVQFSKIIWNGKLGVAIMNIPVFAMKFRFTCIVQHSSKATFAVSVQHAGPEAKIILSYTI